MASHVLTLLEAVGAGLLQGVGEVFPISALGHGVIIGSLHGGAGVDLAPARAQYLYAAGRLAIAVALFAYQWRDWLRIVRGLLGTVVHAAASPAERRWGWTFVLAAAPACIGVALLASRARSLLDRPHLAAAALVANGLLMVGVWLWWRRSSRAGGMSGTHRARVSRTEQAAGFADELSTIRPLHALVIGLMPLGSLVPGASGVGLALVAALLLGLTNEQAAHVTLLLITPFLLTWGLLELPHLSAPQYDGVRTHLVVAVVVALVAAYLTAVLLVRYLARASLRPFGLYCLLAGAGTLAAFALG